MMVAISAPISNIQILQAREGGFTLFARLPKAMIGPSKTIRQTLTGILKTIPKVGRQGLVVDAC